MVSYDSKYQNLSSVLVIDIVISCQCVSQIQATCMRRHEVNRWTWHHHVNDQLDMLSKFVLEQLKSYSGMQFCECLWIYIKISKLLFTLVSYYVYQSAQPTSCKSDWFLMWFIVPEPTSSLHLYLSYYFCISETWKRHQAVFSQSKV